MKKYTKVLTLLLGVGIGVGASGFLGSTETTQTAYANNESSRIQYSQLSGNYVEDETRFDENDEYCDREDSRGCGRGSRDGYRNQNYRNDNYRNDSFTGGDL